jgi:excisionase family DNA binding protein
MPDRGISLMNKRRTKITVQTERLLIIPRRNNATRLWCDRCKGPVTMISSEEASAIAGVSSRTIYRWVEAGRIHFMETDTGALRICVNSITDRLRSARSRFRDKDPE